MITAQEFFGKKPHGAEQRAAAEELLARVNALRLDWMRDTGAAKCPVDRDTGCEISGDAKVGNGDGGFREYGELGSKFSSHKILYVQDPAGNWIYDPAKAQAGVDSFDPGDELDQWLDQFEDGHGGNTKLEEHGLYREHPDDTPGWCHLTARSPHSGKRTFKP